MTTHTKDFILVAVADPVVRPEATHAAAVTGSEVITAEDPREIARLAPRAHRVLVCAATADHVAECGRRTGLYLVAPSPGPLNYEAALRCHADQAFLLPAQSEELLAALAAPDTVTPEPAGHSLVLAVTGACGGVGASTLAACVARYAAAAGETVTLVDAVHGSGGLDLLVGLENTTGARWPDLHLGTGSVDADDLRAALPTTPDGIAVLSTARSSVASPYVLTTQAVDQVLRALAGAPGLTVVDAPRGAIPQAAGHVAVLTAAEVRATAAATELTARLYAESTPHQLVLGHRAWSGLDVEDVEKITRTDVSAEIPCVRKLPRAMEIGGLPLTLPKPLTRAADLMLQEAGWVA